jgi:MFS transporter, SP family, arabinose:H+ symporter
MNSRVLRWSVTTALAEFLFGFDTVVISGADQTIQSLWHLSAGMHGVAIASALYGTVLGSLIGGLPTDRARRRATLLLIGALYLIGAIGSALAENAYAFIAARTVGGLGIGKKMVIETKGVSLERIQELLK